MTVLLCYRDSVTVLPWQYYCYRDSVTVLPWQCYFLIVTVLLSYRDSVGVQVDSDVENVTVLYFRQKWTDNNLFKFARNCERKKNEKLYVANFFERKVCKFCLWSIWQTWPIFLSLPPNNYRNWIWIQVVLRKYFTCLHTQEIFTLDLFTSVR